MELSQEEITQSADGIFAPVASDSKYVDLYKPLRRI